MSSPAPYRSERRATRLKGDSGVALVEAAFVMPVLIMLLLGSLDVAFLYRDQMTLVNAAADGAKFGAIIGPGSTPDGENADFITLEEIRATLGALDPASVERVVIFKANNSAWGSPMDQYNNKCKAYASTVAGSGCNVYVPYTAFLKIEDGEADYFKCTAVETASCGWNPENRKEGPTSNDIEYLGVYIRYDHKNFSPYLGDSRDVEVAKIVRLEPGNLITS